jgi:hypothetical protein
MYLPRCRLLPAALAAALLSLSSLTAVAAPTAKDKEEAKTHLAEGRVAIGINQFDEAIKAFKLSDQLDPNPQTKLELVEALIGGGKLIEASKILNGLLDASAGHPKKIKESAQKLLSGLEPRIPWILVKLTGPSAGAATVTVDGTKVEDIEFETPFDPGTHAVVAEAEGYFRVEKRVKLDEGQHGVVKIDMKPSAPKKKKKKVSADPDGDVEEASAEEEEVEEAPPPPKKKKKKKGADEGGGAEASGGGGITNHGLFIPTVVTGGVGALGLLIGTISGAVALSQTAAVKKSCDGTTCPDSSSLRASRDAALVSGNVSTAFFIIGGAGVAAGGVMLALILTSDNDAPKGKEQAFVRPWIGPGQGGVYGRF